MAKKDEYQPGYYIEDGTLHLVSVDPKTRDVMEVMAEAAESLLARIVELEEHVARLEAEKE